MEPFLKFEFWIGVLAIIGWCYLLADFGKLLGKILEHFIEE